MVWYKWWVVKGVGLIKVFVWVLRMNKFFCKFLGIWIVLLNKVFLNFSCIKISILVKVMLAIVVRSCIFLWNSWC